MSIAWGIYNWAGGEYSDPGETCSRSLHQKLYISIDNERVRLRVYTALRARGGERGGNVTNLPIHTHRADMKEGSVDLHLCSGPANVSERRRDCHGHYPRTAKSFVQYWFTQIPIQRQESWLNAAIDTARLNSLGLDTLSPDNS